MQLKENSKFSGKSKNKILFLGHLIATLSNLAVTKSGMIGFLGKTIVRGPGQNFSAKIFA